MFHFEGFEILLIYALYSKIYKIYTMLADTFDEFINLSDDPNNQIFICCTFTIIQNELNGI